MQSEQAAAAEEDVEPPADEEEVEEEEAPGDPLAVAEANHLEEDEVVEGAVGVPAPVAPSTMAKGIWGVRAAAAAASSGNCSVASSAGELPGRCGGRKA